MRETARYSIKFFDESFLLSSQAILHALSQADGNLSQAASLLGITRYALYRKVNKLGI